jgi:hypothetical protein
LNAQIHLENDRRDKHEKSSQAKISSQPITIENRNWFAYKKVKERIFRLGIGHDDSLFTFLQQVLEFSVQNNFSFPAL